MPQNEKYVDAANKPAMKAKMGAKALLKAGQRDLQRPATRSEFAGSMDGYQGVKPARIVMDNTGYADPANQQARNFSLNKSAYKLKVNRPAPLVANKPAFSSTCDLRPPKRGK